MKHLIIAASLLAAPLHAAPFVVCNLDNNSRIIVDLGDNTLQLGNSDWVYAQVVIEEDMFFAEYANEGYLLGVIHSAAEDKSYWKIITPEAEASGSAFCSYQEK